MIKKNGSATWTGNVKAGNGKLSTESGVLTDSSYGVNSRFEGGEGTNPEELIGAAHAACFSMAFSDELASNGLDPQSVSTQAEICLAKDGDGYKLSESNLKVTVQVKSEDQAKFNTALEAAKKNCPISNVLKAVINVEVTQI